MTNESTINGYNENVNSYDDTSIENIFSEAKAYNNALSDKHTSEKNREYSDIFDSYNSILNLGDGLMGYIEIPEIDVNLPIYHGGSEEVLVKGAVHLEKTSFPIGGINTHTVISAHSGYPTQKFFDDIDELKNGSLIYVHTLNSTLTYKVYSSDVVEPDDSSKLEVIDDKDCLTLVTCYPYGINSHRLLIHAERVNETDENATVDEIPINKKPQNKNVTVLLFIIIFLFLIAVAFFI